MAFTNVLMARKMHCPHTAKQIGEDEPLVYCMAHKGLMIEDAQVFSCGHTVCSACTETATACPVCGDALDFATAEPDTRGRRARLRTSMPCLASALACGRVGV